MDAGEEGWRRAACGQLKRAHHQFMFVSCLPHRICIDPFWVGEEGGNWEVIIGDMLSWQGACNPKHTHTHTPPHTPACNVICQAKLYLLQTSSTHQPHTQANTRDRHRQQHTHRWSDIRVKPIPGPLLWNTNVAALAS